MSKSDTPRTDALLPIGYWNNPELRDPAVEAVELAALSRQLEREVAACQRRCAELETLLNAASHALRSYQYGNGSGELAESIADKIDAALTALRAMPRQQAAPRSMPEKGAPQ